MIDDVLYRLLRTVRRELAPPRTLCPSQAGRGEGLHN
jgi:hypothetical protein